jgi:hypothetical protein
MMIKSRRIKASRVPRGAGHVDECVVAGQREHAGHEHAHGAACGHVAVPHEGHVDYVHDGHRHAVHEGHWDEH